MCVFCVQVVGVCVLCTGIRCVLYTGVRCVCSVYRYT